MPTKPNYGGEQQPYVPQGNGDPSGEYADKEGANVNFKVFAKPQAKPTAPGGSAVAPEKPSIDLTVKKKPVPSPAPSFDDYVKKHPIKNKEVEKFVREAFDKGTDEGKEFITKGFGLGDVSFDREKNGSSKCHVAYDRSTGKRTPPVLMFSPKETSGLASGFYGNGQVFYHESTHAIDFMAYPTGIFPASSRIPLSGGGTLEDKLVAKATEARQMRSQALDDINKFTEELYKGKEFQAAKADSEKYGKELTDLETKLTGGEVDKVRSDFISGKLTIAEFSAKTQVLKDKLASSAERTELLQNKWKADALYRQEELKIQQEIGVEFGDVSDMFEANGGGKIFDMGHGSAYWNRPGAKGAEFFAEYMSAKAANPKSFARIKKYFPDGAEAAEELYAKIMERTSQ